MLYRDSYVKRKFRKQITERYGIVAPLIQKLDAGHSITKAEVLTMVKDPALRHGVFRVLEAYKRNDLFPSEYFTREKGAEGFLVNWLEFPTELGIPPDEIEFLTLITVRESENIDYYVFRYKTKLKLTLGKVDWMIGVSGPYYNHSDPYDIPHRVFSRFNSTDNISPEQEVQWVHDNIRKAEV